MSTYHATKYDSARDEVVAILASVSEGYGRREFGDVEATCGYVQVVVLDSTCDLDFDDTSTNYPHGDYVGELAREYGVTADDVLGFHVVTTNSQGFVSVMTFSDCPAAYEYVEALDASYAEWLGDED